MNIYYESRTTAHSGVFSHFFFFNDTATTEIYTLPLHDALPIYEWPKYQDRYGDSEIGRGCLLARQLVDRKSTRLNSSHGSISYAVFCVKKNNEGAGRRHADQYKGARLRRRRPRQAR